MKIEISLQTIIDNHYLSTNLSVSFSPPSLSLSVSSSVYHYIPPPPTTFVMQPKIVFPKIAIKSSDGPVIVREREKILDEKIVRRTEEVPDPITGQPQLRTVEYIEKIIETEVS